MTAELWSFLMLMPMRSPQLKEHTEYTLVDATLSGSLINT